MNEPMVIINGLHARMNGCRNDIKRLLSRWNVHMHECIRCGQGIAVKRLEFPYEVQRTV